MNQRTAAMKDILTIIVALLAALNAADASQAARPNIIFIVADDLGYGEPSSTVAKTSCACQAAIGPPQNCWIFRVGRRVLFLVRLVSRLGITKCMEWINPSRVCATECATTTFG